MRAFPAEFSDLLNAKGRRWMAEHPFGSRPSAANGFFELIDGIMDPATARSCVRLLDANLRPLLRHFVDKIPRGSIRGMTRNYSESLPKTMSMKTCMLFSRRFREYAPAEAIGLVSMLRSESLRQFAEASTGLRLERAAPQVILYETGDYVGPHNDHHPQNDEVKNGFVDLHIMFGNDAVEHQWLVYERERHLKEIRNVNLKGGVAVYRLPFWHYTTPLAARPGREEQARRWLLLASFTIARRAVRSSRSA
jgi:hypothetical protein